MNNPNILSPQLSNDVKIVGGTTTTASAADTVATGLKNVTSVVASLGSDLADGVFDVTAAPSTNGSIIIKTWKTDGSDPTPAAATAFGAVVYWIATGN